MSSVFSDSVSASCSAESKSFSEVSANSGVGVAVEFRAVSLFSVFGFEPV